MKLEVHCPSRTLRRGGQALEALLGRQPSREWRWSGVPASGIDPAESERACQLDWNTPQ
jgi:hypothetical protein